MQFMLSWFLSIIFSLTFGTPAIERVEKGQIWAVLVAGSKGYNYYRHQADVCHAYQILHRNGVPDSNIVVMMYDDIANSSYNPNKGVIINQPGGPNVYSGVPKDYTGDDVNVQNFLNVLLGKAAIMKGVGSGKVLQSGPNDHIIINFVDRGSTGNVAFPNERLYADDLINVLKKMHKQKLYKKLLFYMEASESGSMFYNLLPKNIDILAMTACNSTEESYACYWDANLQVYLGDIFSVAWMEDIDSAFYSKNLTRETVQKHYTNVANRVVKEYPTLYGAKKITKDKLTDFIGGGKKIMNNQREVQASVQVFKDTVSNREVALETLNRRIALAKNEDSKEKLLLERDYLLKGREEINIMFNRILRHLPDVNIKQVEDLHSPLSLEMMPCYKTLVERFNEDCININQNPFVMRHLFKLANLCTIDHFSVDLVLEAYMAECTSHLRELKGIM